MKVIKDNTKRKVTCVHCKSELEICDKDLMHDHYEYFGIPHVDNYFYCPCCGEKNII